MMMMLISSATEQAMLCVMMKSKMKWRLWNFHVKNFHPFSCSPRTNDTFFAFCTIKIKYFFCLIASHSSSTTEKNKTEWEKLDQLSVNVCRGKMIIISEFPARATLRCSLRGEWTVLRVKNWNFVTITDFCCSCHSTSSKAMKIRRVTGDFSRNRKMLAVLLPSSENISRAHY